LKRWYRGFWVSEGWLTKSLAPTHERFNSHPTDVFLASFPKSGTTWLKALAFCVLNRTAHPPSAGADHPLRRGNPHDLVSFLEANPYLIAYATGEDELYEHLPSPRLLATHIPYSLLPHGITDGECKMVYVCRDPKDTLVSLWNFHKKTIEGLQQEDPGLSSASASLTPTIEEAFELFCEGKFVAGPQWRHVLEYWEASCRRPDHVLFLRYEDMLRHPERNLRRLAAFMGCPFSPEEEADGMVRDVVELCSLGTLKALEVNRSGSTVWGIKNDAFFRKGTMGDWSNFMTPAMAARLDGIVAEELKGSGLTYGSGSSSNS
jgi:hypothetical protein